MFWELNKLRGRMMIILPLLGGGTNELDLICRDARERRLSVLRRMDSILNRKALLN